MRILLIDNHTVLLQELEKAVSGEVTVKNWDEVTLSDANGFDLIILSGSRNFFPIEGNEQKLFNEIDLVRQTNVPLIGICYGCQIIARAFGASVEKMDTRHEGIMKITITAPDSVFEGRKEFTVFEAHRFVISDLPPMLISMAESRHGIEMIKHKTLPIYGLQFHPEHEVNKNDGLVIFKNILKKFNTEE